MKIGKYAEEALREHFLWACADVKKMDEYIERETGYRDDYQKRINLANVRREEAIAKKVELRSTLIKLGIDPEEEDL